MQEFNGDTYLKEHFERLVAKHGIKTIIETGTYKGDTTSALAKMADKVVTVEYNKDFLAEAMQSLKDIPNVEVWQGSSEKTLPYILKDIQQPVLLFLDAHWYNYNPLLDELKVIAAAGLKPVIVIHDFKVPNHPELKYDTYKGQAYEWSWITEDVKGIYGNNFTVSYNDKATGAEVGVIIIEP